MRARIHLLSSLEPVRFAAKELRRCLTIMTGATPEIRKASAYDPGEPGVWVGLSRGFGSRVPRRATESGEFLADAVYVSARDGHAIVAGANPRSALFAAYRYLEELGCRWLRPGRHGERIPRRPDALLREIRLVEVPSLRMRALAMEASLSARHAMDMIDYMARRGFNGYKIQTSDGYSNFNRWHALERPRGRRRGKPLTLEESSRLAARVKRELRRRGMLIHSMGHGWTTLALGAPAEDWEKRLDDPPPSVRRHLALIGGKRSYFRGDPMNTNLCMADPATRKLMVRAVVEYAARRPEEDILHVWIADGSNNACECWGCRRARPSDFYVRILNDIDAELTRLGLATRIVFLAYVDLLWGPTKQRIRNPDRFILMFAPITRSFSSAFLDQLAGDEAVTPYRRNRLVFPKTPGGNLKLLETWNRAFRGATVDYDYHIWRDHVRDPAHMASLPVLFKDARDLSKLGLCGYIGCSTQRIAMPTGALVHVLGRTLWNSRVSYRPMVDAYFADLYGAQGREVRAYLEKLSRLFDPPFLRGEKLGEPARRRAVRNIARIPGVVEAFMTRIERGRRSADPATAAHWETLAEHAWYVASLARLYEAAFGGKTEEANRLWAELRRGLDQRLPRIHRVFDTYRARSVIEQILGLAKRMIATIDV